MFRQEYDSNCNCWVIAFTSFSHGYERILKALYFDFEFDPKFATKIILQEFELFTQHTMRMDHESFVNAWFDIADSWYASLLVFFKLRCTTTDETSYAEFFYSLLQTVSYSVDFAAFESLENVMRDFSETQLISKSDFAHNSRLGCFSCGDNFPHSLLFMRSLSDIKCIFGIESKRSRSIVETYTTAHHSAFRSAITVFNSLFANIRNNAEKKESTNSKFKIIKNAIFSGKLNGFGLKVMETWLNNLESPKN